LQLRPTQQECGAAVLREFETAGSTAVAAPTGWGKTVFFAWLAKHWPQGRVLILAHREELVFQAARKVEAALGEKPDIEMAEFRASPTLYGGSKVIVASVASLYREGRIGLPTYDPAAFGLVIVDEAHHAVSTNKTYARILSHFRRNPACKVLGVSATWDRSDGKPLGEMFASVAYRYSLRQAIDDAWLVPIRQQYVVCNHLDFSAVKTHGKKGDFVDHSLAAVMEEERALHEVVGPTIELAGDRPTLIFAASIAHAERVAEIINRHPGKRAVCVHGGNGDYACSNDQRRRRLQEYAEGGYQFLVGCDVFYEGFDEPRIACVAVARPTKSRSRYTQAVGRGTRILPSVVLDQGDAAARAAAIAASGKPDLLVLDYVGASAALKLDLASTADLLAGDGASGEAVQRAKKKAKDQGGSADMRELVEEAEREIADETEREKRKALAARADYYATDVDPFAWGDEAHAGGAGLAGNRKPVTPGQARILERYGFRPEEMHRKQASAVIDKILRTPSPAQCKALRRNGESDDVHRDKAGALLDVLAARRWKRRDYALSRDRLSLKRDGEDWLAVVKDPEVGSVVLGRRFPSEEKCRAFLANCVEAEPPAREAA
jgi:superfamily II DNA or RNA helicase